MHINYFCSIYLCLSLLMPALPSNALPCLTREGSQVILVTPPSPGNLPLLILTNLLLANYHTYTYKIATIWMLDGWLTKKATTQSSQRRLSLLILIHWFGGEVLENTTRYRWKYVDVMDVGWCGMDYWTMMIIAWWNGAGFSRSTRSSDMLFTVSFTCLLGYLEPTKAEKNQPKWMCFTDDSDPQFALHINFPFSFTNILPPQLINGN